MSVSDPRDLSAFGVESHWLQPVPAARRLLIAYPHPDDESFGNAGTIARYAREGAGVHYACATRGEAGTVKAEYLDGYSDVGALRTAELACAADALGLTGLHFLNYRDSGMQGSADNAHPASLVQAPLAEVAGRLVVLIRTLRPQVVITFAPYGGYGHPDHIKIHHATMAAFEAAGDARSHPEQLAAGLAPWQPQRLYYATFGTRLLRAGVAILQFIGQDPRRAGTNRDVDFVEAARQATPVTTTIDTSAYIEEKLRAWECHRSQLGGMGLLRMPNPLRTLWLGREQFTRAIPPWTGGPTERDLFAGLPVAERA
jgi:mycothiol S-conjugate amidase